MLSPVSIERLRACHPDIQRVVELAASRFPFTVLCGFRGEEEQTKAFAEGKSRAKWGESKHNATPSQAVDLAPLPIDWENLPRFRTMANVVLQAAKELNVQLVWGGDFKKLKDMPHFELASPKK